MALIKEWIIETFSQSDGDLITTWIANVGPDNMVSPGGSARPTYKTAITPTGKPVLRFDGVNDDIHAAFDMSASIVKHVFIVAAYRPAAAVLFNSLAAADAQDPKWENNTAAGLFDNSSNVVFSRDGVNTRSFYTNGQFAIYDALMTTPPSGFDFLNFGNGGGSYGQWDVCYVGVYDAPVTGSTYTAKIAALTATYTEPVLLNEWKIETISAADNDPISDWPPNVGSDHLTNGGGSVRPLYKTAITPSGKPVLRFDGVNDVLGITGVDHVKHIFLVAAFRPSIPTASGVLFGTSDGAADYAGDLDSNGHFDTLANCVFARDGIATDLYYTNGQFAVYDIKIVTPESPLRFTLANYVATYFGQWDVAYAALLSGIVSGSEYTAKVAALTATYITPYVPLSITTTVLPDVAIGAAYHQHLDTANGAGGVTSTVISGALPTGITLDPATGYFDATAVTAAAGVYTFTAQATDGTTSPTKVLSIRVYDPSLTLSEVTNMTQYRAGSIASSDLPSRVRGALPLPSYIIAPHTGAVTWSDGGAGGSFAISGADNSQAIYTPKNKTQNVVITAIDDTGTYHLPLLVYGTMPIQPQFGFDTEGDITTKVAMAKDRTRYFREDGDVEITWAFSWDGRERDQKNELWQFWRDHRKTTQFYMVDVEGDILNRVWFSSSMKWKPNGANRFDLAASFVGVDENLTVSTAEPLHLRINAGGGPEEEFTADQYYTGGYSFPWPDIVGLDVSGIIHVPPDAVWGTVHYDPTLVEYLITGLRVNHSYDVRLFFMMPISVGAGQDRVMTPKIQGVTKPNVSLTNNSIAQEKIYSDVLSDNDGQMRIQVVKVSGANALMNAYEVIENA